jgi:hypothetical protein
MAVTNISPTKLKLNEAGALTFTVPSSATDGFSVDYTEQDSKLVLLLQNTSTSATATATIKAGDGIQGVADYVQNLAASSVNAVRIESGKFKRVTGDSKGKVIVIPSAATVAAALVLIP